MYVKIRVFEDYSIQSDIIRPVGKSTIKTLNANDIRKALNLFLKIKSYNDVIKFAKSYGLLLNKWASEKTNDNASLVYSEMLGFEKENEKGWIDFKHKLKALAKIENEKEASNIADMLNKELNSPIVLEYAYTKKANGKYIIKPSVGFQSIYEAFMWLVVSKDMSIKICPVCGNVFVAKRSDTVYCSSACLMRDRRRSVNHTSNS